MAITKVANTKNSFEDRPHFTRIDVGTCSSPLGPSRDEFSRGAMLEMFFFRILSANSPFSCVT